MLTLWGLNSLRWTKVSEMCENKDMGLLPGAMCPHAAIPASHSHLGLFFSVFLGHLCSILLPLLPRSLSMMGSRVLCLWLLK